jgi:hypothetical protein
MGTSPIGINARGMSGEFDSRQGWQADKKNPACLAARRIGFLSGYEY